MRTLFSRMIWLILGLGGFLYCQLTPSNESTVENYWLKGDTLLIRINDGTGWRLDIYREGRGSIRYGRHPNNVLTFDPASFKFDVLRWQLAADTKTHKERPPFHQARVVYLSNKGENEQTASLHDIELGWQLFSVALNASLNEGTDLRSKRRMLKLFKNNPPFGKSRVNGIR